MMKAGINKTEKLLLYRNKAFLYRENPHNLLSVVNKYVKKKYSVKS